MEKYYHQELFTSYISLQEETTSVNILIDNVMASQNWKSFFLSHFACHSASAFGFHENWRSTTRKPFVFTFKIWRQNWNIFFQSRVMALCQWYKDFRFLHKIYWNKQNYGNLGAKWHIFSKALMEHYHYTKFRFLAYY